MKHVFTHVFTYGSLMFPQVWERVVHRRYKNSDAFASGLVRKKITLSTYPVAFPGDPVQSLQGRLYRDVEPADLARLDRFEGKYYERKQITVTISGEDQATVADVYMLKPRYRLLASAEDWSPEHFRKYELQRFVNVVYARNFT